MWEAIIAAGTALIGALISAGKEGEAQRVREQMAAQYGPEILPDLDRAVAQQAGPAAPRVENDANRREQLATLAELDNVYRTGGRTDADEAAYTQAGRKVAARAGQRAGEQTIETARRGQAGSPLSAAMASQNGQDELEALAQLDAEVASSGRDRALGALTAKGQLASGIRGDDWRALNAEADATDIANRFNASQRQATEMYNVQLPQQEFQNDMQRRAAQNQARAGVAAGLEGQGAAARQTAAGLGNAALSYGQGWDWGQKKKEDDK
jgi:hypothetical protein